MIPDVAQSTPPPVSLDIFTTIYDNVRQFQIINNITYILTDNHTLYRLDETEPILENVKHFIYSNDILYYIDNTNKIHISNPVHSPYPINENVSEIHMSKGIEDGHIYCTWIDGGDLFIYNINTTKLLQCSNDVFDTIQMITNDEFYGCVHGSNTILYKYTIKEQNNTIVTKVSREVLHMNQNIKHFNINNDICYIIPNEGVIYYIENDQIQIPLNINVSSLSQRHAIDDGILPVIIQYQITDNGDLYAINEQNILLKYNK